MANDGGVRQVALRGSLVRFFEGWAVPLLLLTVVALLAMSGCSRKNDDAADVIILHSGRMRGNVYPLSLQSIAALQHYQYLAGYVRKAREEASQTGAKVLVIDLGDSLTGSFASHVTGSENMVTFFNDAGYDALLLSNLDYAVQPQTLAKLKAKVLNPFQDAAEKPATDGTVFGTKLTAGDIPVYLLANFYGDASSNQYPDRFPAWFGTTPTAVTPVRDYAKVLSSLGQKAGEGLTLLSWMKFESPKDQPEAFLQELRRVGVNAILAHRIYGGKEKDAWTASGFTDWRPPVSVNILRNNGGFALARLDLKRDGKTWKVLKHELLPMTANSAPADNTMIEAIARYAGPISDADTKLGNLAESVPPEAILKTYMTALATEPGTQAVLYSLQSIRTSWLAGELRTSQVFNSLPWTTPVVQLTLSPEQITRVSQDLNLAILQNDGLDADAITVTTSDFFGRLIAAKLAIPPDAIKTTAQKSEFDFFVEYLKTNPGAVTGAASSPGWSWSGKLQP